MFQHIWKLSPGARSLQKGQLTTRRLSCTDTKISDGETPVMMELWGMWSTPSLPLLPGLF